MKNKNKDDKPDPIDLGSYAHWLLTEAVISTVNFAEANYAKKQNKASLKDYSRRWRCEFYRATKQPRQGISRGDVLKSLGKNLRDCRKTK
jgi:hypothetical protein